MERPNGQVHWLPDEEYQRAVRELRNQVGKVFTPFDIYGLGVNIPPAVHEVIKLAEDFGLRVRGVDKVIAVKTRTLTK